MRGFTSTAWRHIGIHKKINLTKIEKIFKKVLTIIFGYGKINAVKEIEKPFLSYQLTKRLFTQTLKSDCTKYSNISLFAFQVFSHKNFLKVKKK